MPKKSGLKSKYRTARFKFKKSISVIFFSVNLTSMGQWRYFSALGESPTQYGDRTADRIIEFLHILKLYNSSNLIERIN